MPQLRLDIEHVESFLANEELAKIVYVTEKGRETVAKFLLNKYATAKNGRELWSDTQESAEAATVDAHRTDRAEDKVAHLQAEAPEAWTLLKEVVPAISSYVTESD